MDEYVIDPTAFERPLLDSRRRAALRTRVEQEALDRAKIFGVKVIAHEPRRVADVALLWFQGDRPSVLALVGGWTPTDAVRLHIAHAGPQGTRYELALYAVFDGEDDAGDVPLGA